MKSDFSSVLLVLGLVLNSLVLFCNGGITSKFVRKVEKSIDMPLHSDVFRVHPGHNAPQQVATIFSEFCMLWVPLITLLKLLGKGLFSQFNIMYHFFCFLKLFFF